MQPQIVIRVDASERIGTGHVMRCLNLAEQLKSRNASVEFLCRLHKGHLCETIESRGFKVHSLLPPKTEQRTTPSVNYSAWLGATWQKDAEQTIQRIKEVKQKVDWMVVDHYAIDHQWEQRVCPCIDKLLVIDDLADRKHDCDYLLDQNAVHDMHSRYKSLVSSRCNLLIGPRYALLHKEYALLHKSFEVKNRIPRRIFAFFGGVDEHNLAGKVLETFTRLQKREIALDLVLGKKSKINDQLLSIISDFPNIKVYEQLSSLATLMGNADLAIGACGVTNWERMCLGLPSVVITIAENQQNIAEYLSTKGLIHYVGKAESLDLDLLEETLRGVLQDGLGSSISKGCHAMVDGRGGERVASILLVDPESELFPRRATEHDEQLLLDWANDPQTRENAFNQNIISAAEHHRWFHDRLREPEDYLIYIVEDSRDVPIGLVRLEKVADSTYEIHYSIDKNYRRRKLGLPLLRSVLSELTQKQSQPRLIANVKQSNIPSQKIFLKLGFEKKAEITQNQSILFECTDPNEN